jgi:hypothetical protein
MTFDTSHQERGVNLVYFKERENKWQKNGRYCTMWGFWI